MYATRVDNTTCRVAYLINQYPKVSHTFIRREILALERLGLKVSRYAIRGWNDVLSDPADIAERQQTRYALKGGLLALVGPVVKTLLAHPVRFFSAVALAWRNSRTSEKPLPYHLIYLAEACRLLGWMREDGVDHVHSHFGTNSTDVAMLLRELGGPSYSFTVHGPEEFDKPAALTLGEKIGRSSFVVAISSFGRGQLYRWIGSEHWNKVQLVHCGLEPDYFSQAQLDRTSMSLDSRRLVCVGRICEQKAQRLLVCAVHQLLREGVDLELVLAGDGEMRAEIEALVHSLDMQDRVRITGWISGEEVRREILAARALVLPSFAEGLPVVIMEAMALRRPIVSTYIAGIPELVRHSQEGWLCAAGDVDALAEVIRECLQASAQTREQMGESASLRVAERHNIDREAAKLSALLRSAVVAGSGA